MNDADGLRLEAAEQFGFEAAEVYCGNTELYSCTPAQLVAFAKACERAGRAQVARHIRQAEQFWDKAHTFEGAPFCAGACDALAGQIEKANAIIDAELALVLAAVHEAQADIPPVTTFQERHPEIAPPTPCRHCGAPYNEPCCLGVCERMNP